MPSTTGSVQDNKKRYLLSFYPGSVNASLQDLWLKFKRQYLTAASVTMPTGASGQDSERYYWAQRCVASAVFADLPTALKGYSTNDLRKRALVAWAITNSVSTTNKSANDLELAYWRSL